MKDKINKYYEEGRKLGYSEKDLDNYMINQISKLKEIEISERLKTEAKNKGITVEEYLKQMPAVTREFFNKIIKTN